MLPSAILWFSAAAQALSLVAIGVGVWVAPALAGRSYGLPITDDTGRTLLRGLGMRDLSLGLVLALLLWRDVALVPVALLATAPIAISDFIMVSQRHAPRVARLTHLAGACALIGTAVGMWWFA